MYSMLFGNNSGGGANALLDGASFYLELTHTAVPARGSIVPSFTRATTKTWQNNDGYLVTGVAGEIGFVGARRVRNLVSSSDISTWSTTSGVAIGSGVTDPDGGTTAYTLTCTSPSGYWVDALASKLSIGVCVNSCYVRRRTGTGVVRIYNGATWSGTEDITAQITTEWTRIIAAATAVTALAANFIGFDFQTAGDAIDVWHPQCEDVTTQTTQTAGEYVSVGAPTDWAGPELVTNGTFDTDTTWIKESGWTIGGGVATHAAGVSATLYQWFNFVAGATYVFSWDTVISAGAVSLRVGGGYLIPIDFKSASGTYTATYTAVTTFTDLLGFVCDAPFAGTIDNFSVKPAIYHGSMVDGVKCFPTDISGNPLPTAYTYDAVSLNGVAGTYVSTPDSVAASIVGSIDIDVKAAMNDWTPAAIQTLLGKDTTAGNNRSYLIYVNTNGTLEFGYTNNGSSFVGRIATSSVAPTVANGAAIWVRVTYNSTTGKVNFYTSADGESWTALGTEQTITSGAIYDGTGIVEVGSNGGTGTSNMFAGKIYRARIYNGIRESGGTLAVDFDASRYAGGTTLTGSTGETWTLQGNAVIHPTNQPALGFQAEGARTNLVVRSNELDNASWGKNNATVSANTAVASDGTTSLDKIVEAATTSTHSAYQTFAGTSGSYTVSVEMQQAERTWGFITEGNSVTASAFFDLANGVVGTVAGTGSPSATITALANGAYRCTMTFTAGANANCQFGPAVGDGAASYTGDITKGIYAGMVGFENASFASSYIATTTVAVTRDADNLTYSGGDIPNLKTLLSSSTASNIGTGAARVIAGLSNGTTGTYTIHFIGSGDLDTIEGATGGTQWIMQGTARTVNSLTKIASSWATNDVKGSKNGVALTQDTTATMPVVDRLEVGHLAGTLQPNANVGGIYGWTRNLSQSELNAITA